MNKYRLPGSILLEVLLSIGFFFMILLSFLESHKSIVKLESFSKNINKAICLAEYKIIDCKNINVFYNCNKPILKKYGSFKLTNNFIWSCKFKYLLFKNINYVYNKNNKLYLYKQDISFILYRMLKKLLYKKIMRLDITIFWEKNTIKLITYINILNDK